MTTTPTIIAGTLEIHATDADSSQRLDKFLAIACADLSRSRLQALIAQGHVRRQDIAITDGASKVKSGEIYTVFLPAAVPSHIEPQAMALDVVYEDEDVIIINKQAGLTVHPAAGNRDRTLVNALLAHCGDSLSGIGGVERPGIVHRIDKDTTGLLVVAKHDAAHRALSEQLADRTLGRVYYAVCWGRPLPASGSISGNIGRSPSNRQKMAIVKQGGKQATTHYRTLASHAEGVISLVECKLETGRTHQIRVHMLHIGHPLVGDATYGSSTSTRMKSAACKQLSSEAKDVLIAFKRQALHAGRIAFIHPRSNKHVQFTAPLPDDMQHLLHQVEINSPDIR